jgi:hypothetical protein
MKSLGMRNKTAQILPVMTTTSQCAIVTIPLSHLATILGVTLDDTPASHVQPIVFKLQLTDFACVGAARRREIRDKLRYWFTANRVLLFAKSGCPVSDNHAQVAKNDKGNEISGDKRLV